MKTLTLEEAAEFLHVHPVTLLRLAQSGKVPAAKPGKRWVFIDVDLAEWLRSQYSTRNYGNTTSTEKKVTSYSLLTKEISSDVQTSPEIEKAYRDLLKLPAK